MGSTAAAAAVAVADLHRENNEKHTKVHNFLNPLATTPQYSAHPAQPQVPPKVNPFNKTALNHSNQQQQQLFQNMVKSQQAAAANTLGKQKINRSTPNGEESPSRQLLPILVCLITFATVLSVLIIYMDTTEIRHQQFRLNMSRDYELQGISQDNPGLISYVREVHLRKYANTPYFAQPEEEEEDQEQQQQVKTKKKNSESDWDYRGRRELTPEMAQFVVEDLLAGKRRGVFVQSMTGANDALMTAQWLVGGAAWTGVIIEPEPRKYFNYRKHYGHRGVDTVHACVSPNEYPKEVTLRAEEEEENEVKINSVLGGGATDEDEDTEAWFHSRVKCFPLYTILLATNRTKVDLLSLGCHGKHLQVSDFVYRSDCFD